MPVLNITNGEYFNAHLLKTSGGVAVPFCEAMMEGEAADAVFSPAFVARRARALGVSEEAYAERMLPTLARVLDFSSLVLWFGKDTFCQMNLLTLLAYLEEVGYAGEVTLNYIDDESFAVLEGDVPVSLGAYGALYQEILLQGRVPEALGVLDARAIRLYFDYRSADGALARLARENAALTDESLLCLLLERSGEYGLSDTQAKKIITSMRGNMKKDEMFMRQAIALSKAAVAHGNEPFGAVLVKDDEVVYTNENQIYTRCDPTFHAEMGLIRRFVEETGITDLSAYTLYSSCEPCFMCSGAMVWTKLGRLVYGASDIDLCEILGVTGAECSKTVFAQSGAHTAVTAGVLREEALAVLKDYFTTHNKG